ncbi:MAG: ABC-F family ATP-binding cassette domain-containing protein [Proteiniphilum sp.]|jgi:macrolide transport system ATP-binding/permease protein|nr:ABC-F family ATP-binding cassette domain-containing protein [Proteiniphilum sp.]MDD3909855.1 ABC-F family ATP-binding cassette domain-containing protein [Proteiniphilum sp.]
MLLSCQKVKKVFGDLIVLNGIDLDICRGDRIGLVGRNGTGKSTLANIINGNLAYDEGQIITSRQHVSIGYLRQTEAQPEFMVQVINSEIGMNGEFQRLASHLGMNQINNWSGERLFNMSGGEKTKLALASVWASQPDLIILDEPTNHMDYQGVAYLISELARYQGAAIIISHDRYFLDRTVSQIAELENGMVRMYTGNYSAYRQARQKERESQWRIYQSQQKEQTEIDTAIDQLKNWSAKAHRESRKKGEGLQGGKEYYRKKAKKRDQAVKSQIKRLEKMRQKSLERPAKEQPVNFILNAWGKGGRRLLEADGISKSYGERLLFRDSSFFINRGEKIGILGPNGCGKTTLVKIILGQETLDTGTIFLSSAARIAYVSQELPQGEKGTLQELIKDWTRDDQKSIFQFLITIGIAYDRLQVSMGELSRGERMKIAMGLAIMGQYDLLILDEPTNHLDVHSREALEESLRQFPGSILLITHDRYFLEQICDGMLVFEQQRIMRIEGNSAKKQFAETRADSVKTSNDEETLVLETRISWVLGQLNRYKPGDPKYTALDKEYSELIQRKNALSKQL